METEGAKRDFELSINKRKLGYVEYLNVMSMLKIPIQVWR